MQSIKEFLTGSLKAMYILMLYILHLNKPQSRDQYISVCLIIPVFQASGFQTVVCKPVGPCSISVSDVHCKDLDKGIS